MKRVKILLLLGVLMLILTACDEMEFQDWEEDLDGEEITEVVDEYKFKKHDTRERVMFIYTKEQTYVWGVKNIKFIETKDNESTIEYVKAEDGTIQGRKYYVAKDKIKEYSTEYAELFEATIKIGEK